MKNYPPANVDKLIQFQKPNLANQESPAHKEHLLLFNQGRKRNNANLVNSSYTFSKATIKQTRGSHSNWPSILSPLGKAPGSEASKHLYSVYPATGQILAKLGRMRSTLPILIARRRSLWRSLLSSLGLSCVSTVSHRSRDPGWRNCGSR